MSHWYINSIFWHSLSVMCGVCVCASDDHYPPYPLPGTVKVLGTNSPDTNEDKKRCEVRQEAVVTVIRPLTSGPDLHPCDVHQCDHGAGACATHLSTGKGDKLRAFTTCHSCREWTTPPPPSPPSTHTSSFPATLSGRVEWGAEGDPNRRITEAPVVTRPHGDRDEGERGQVDRRGEGEAVALLSDICCQNFGKEQEVTHSRPWDGVSLSQERERLPLTPPPHTTLASTPPLPGFLVAGMSVPACRLEMDIVASGPSWARVKTIDSRSETAMRQWRDRCMNFWIEKKELNIKNKKTTHTLHIFCWSFDAVLLNCHYVSGTGGGGWCCHHECFCSFWESILSSTGSRGIVLKQAK